MDFECFWYCWWFRSLANQLRLAVYPIIYKVLGTIPHINAKALGRWDSCRDAGLISEAGFSGDFGPRGCCTLPCNWQFAPENRKGTDCNSGWFGVLPSGGIPPFDIFCVPNLRSKHGKSNPTIASLLEELRYFRYEGSISYPVWLVARAKLNFKPAKSICFQSINALENKKPLESSKIPGYLEISTILKGLLRLQP